MLSATRESATIAEVELDKTILFNYTRYSVLMSDDGLSIDGPKTVKQSLLVLLVSVGVMGYGAVDYVQSTNAVRDSVETEAMITEVSVETVSSGTGSSRTVNFEPVVVFTYSYQGETYTGDDVFPGSVVPNYGTESAARDVIAAYEPETTATVYVDPDNPETAFLKNQTSNRQFVFAGIGLVLTLLSALSAVRNYRRGRI
jgi:Protein of unknown function (DUF3592).